MTTIREYDEVLERVAHFDTPARIRLLADVAVMLRDMKPSGKKHSIMEIEGLGKEIWQGVDAQEYVNQERTSWNG